MTYFIVIEKHAEKFLDKLDFSIQKEFDRLILEELAKNPLPLNKKHILDTKGNSLLCELDFKKWRVYYIYTNETILIAQISFDGIVRILDGYSNHKSGSNNWSNQKKIITKLKKEFKRK